MKKLTHTLMCATIAAAALLSGNAALAQAAPDDAQIAGIVVAANTVDIDAGKLAEKTTKNKDVKAFAKQMVTDHTGVNKQATALVKTRPAFVAHLEQAKKLQAAMQ